MDDLKQLFSCYECGKKLMVDHLTDRGIRIHPCFYCGDSDLTVNIKRALKPPRDR